MDKEQFIQIIQQQLVETIQKYQETQGFLSLEAYSLILAEAIAEGAFSSLLPEDFYFEYLNFDTDGNLSVNGTVTAQEFIGLIDGGTY